MTEETKSNRTGFFSLFGAIGIAILSSACCWLPLLLISLGVSSVGISSLVEVWRIPLLFLIFSLLGFSFYFIYFRKPACNPDGSCSVSDPKVSKRNKRLLWFSTLIIFLLTFFPEYSTLFIQDGFSNPTQPVSEQKTVYTIKGMTCGGCALGIQAALEKIDGVQSVTVSYEKAEATILWKSSPNDTRVIETLETLGYEAKRTQKNN